MWQNGYNCCSFFVKRLQICNTFCTKVFHIYKAHIFAHLNYIMYNESNHILSLQYGTLFCFGAANSAPFAFIN